MERIKELFHHRVPAPSSAYCLELFERYDFRLTLRKNRVTKVGDFTFRPGQIPQITLNHDLHPFMFLLTYIHEVAHLDVHQRYGNRVEAHGNEWKKAFQTLLTPVMSEEVFPSELYQALQKHMLNPKASSFSDAELTKVIRQFDPRGGALVILSEIPEGSTFSLNGRWFVKGKLRRTRFECKEMKSKKNYLVPADVPIQNAQLSLL